MRRARPPAPAARLRFGAGLLAAAALTLAGCTDGSDVAAAPASASASSTAAGAVPEVLAGFPGIDEDTELIAEDGTGPSVLQLPDAGQHRSLVYTITCSDPDVPFRLRFLLASGQEAYPLSSAGCGSGSGETPQLDPDDPPVMLEVTVPEGARWTAYVYGTPPVAVTG